MQVFNGLHQASSQLPEVGLKAIYNAIHRCKYKVIQTEKLPQTNENNICHRQARYNWFMQLLARMKVKVDDVNSNEKSEFCERLKDDWIDIDNLDAKGHTFELEQVAFWDEIHIYQIAGCHKDKTLVFARNED